MTKHTPGPWVIEEGLAHGHMRVWGPSNLLIAEVLRPHGNFYPTKANAKLMEAAPELLEALEDIVDWISVHDQAAAKYNKAKAVIAKAKGE